VVTREDGLTDSLSLSLSLSLANACNPLLQAHPPWAQDNTSRGSLFPLVFHLAPTHLGWDTQRQFTRRSRDPPGPKRRQLARQVGACYVLTNSFPSKLQMGSLQQPLQAGTLLRFGSLEFMSLDDSYDMVLLPPPRDNDNDGDGIDDVFPAWRKSGIRVCPVTFPAAGGGGGATMAKQETAPRWLSSESTMSAPQRGTRRALTSLKVP
jgi:hypothetical protein